ncbi:hypothetical protein FRC15_003330 [Serendipita sp. 397]|nr:hypothetical protein FRC15_003330 [Serendipita sp. 397]
MTSTIELKATQSKVHAVTVFQADRAEVVRLFKVDLKSGQNEVDISQLPTVLDEDSIRVDGVGSNAIISDVIYHPPTSSDSDRKHEEAVKELQQTKSVLEQELAIYKKQEDILQAYSETLKGADTDGAKLSDFLDIYAKRQTGIDGKVRELKEQINEIDEKITKEGELWSADKEGKKRAARVTVVVSAEHDGEAEICLTYMVSNASWRPLYDLRATVGPTKTSIVLHYRANITQSTGEDWKEVELTLSTASPQLGSTIPSLKPLWVNPIYNIVRSDRFQNVYRGGGSYMKESAKNAMDTSNMMVGSQSMRGGSRSPILQAAMLLPDTIPFEGTMSTSFFIEGLSTIPSDTDVTSQAHKVTVSVIDLTADLQWITVPRELPTAFLQAQIKNTSTYMLLPGKTNVFLDDNFVSKSFIDQVSPSEIFHISLGVDSQVKVTYHPRTKKTRTQGGLLSSRSVITNYHQKVTVKNTRSAPIKKLLVRDQLPVSGDQRIKVALLEPASLEFGGRNTISGSGTGKTKVKEKNLNVPKEVQVSKGVVVRWKVNEDEEAAAAAAATPDDASENGTQGLDGVREGMIEWVCEIGAGQNVDVMLAWEVTAPVGLNWGPQ